MFFIPMTQGGAHTVQPNSFSSSIFTRVNGHTKLPSSVAPHHHLDRRVAMQSAVGHHYGQQLHGVQPVSDGVVHIHDHGSVEEDGNSPQKFLEPGRQGGGNVRALDLPAGQQHQKHKDPRLRVHRQRGKPFQNGLKTLSGTGQRTVTMLTSKKHLLLHS